MQTKATTTHVTGSTTHHRERRAMPLAAMNTQATVARSNVETFGSQTRERLDPAHPLSDPSRRMRGKSAIQKRRKVPDTADPTMKPTRAILATRMLR
jgi:hypothetical protein